MSVFCLCEILESELATKRIQLPSGDTAGSVNPFSESESMIVSSPLVISMSQISLLPFTELRVQIILLLLSPTGLGAYPRVQLVSSPFVRLSIQMDGPMES